MNLFTEEHSCIVAETRCLQGKFPVSILGYFNVWKKFYENLFPNTCLNIVILRGKKTKTHTLLRPVSQYGTWDSGDVLLRNVGAPPPPPPHSKLLTYESLIPFAGYCPSRFRSDHLWTTPAHTSHVAPRMRMYSHYELLHTLRKQMSSYLPYFLIRLYGKVLMPLRLIF